LEVDVLPADGVAQDKPFGEAETLPPAVITDLLAVTLRVCVGTPKLAVTDFAALMATVQVVAVPVHAPLQPVKAEPAAGVAVSTTEVPCA
jgi:hypothetical protein